MVKNVINIFCKFKIETYLGTIKLLNNGAITTSTNDIIKTLMEYYTGIFNDDTLQSTNFSLLKYMKLCPYPKLTNAQQILCVGPINEEELYDAICSFQNGKSPGLD